jgi:hypothetical protein
MLLTTMWGTPVFIVVSLLLVSHVELAMLDTGTTTLSP